MDNSIIFILFCGGFIVAFVCLLIATFARSSRGLRWSCLVAAFCGLIYEGGCFSVASAVGRATGGGSDGSWKKFVALAFVIGVLWSLVILRLSAGDKDERGVDKKNSDDAES